MANKYLDSTGLATLWSKIKAIIPQPSSTTPSMDGSGSTGTGTTWARADHVHPSDTSKVDKVSGKGLSTNDYTTAEKNKLSGIEAGAEVNVNADWNATSGDAQILNKPTIPSAGTGTSYPAMDGTRALGTQNGYARVDHVHPSDTSRVPTTRKVNGKALSSDISLTASDVGALSSSGDLITAYANDGDSDKNPILHVHKGDTFGFVEGTGISITPSSTDEGESYDHQLQISGVAATTSSNGLMSSVDKTKLNGIASGAQVNVLEGVQVNGTDLTITNKKVNVLTAYPYVGISTTGASTQAKAVTIGIDKFYVGMKIAVLFRVGNSYSSPQLTILGKTLNVLNKNFAPGASGPYRWRPNSVISFVLMPLDTSSISIGEEVTNPSTLTHCWYVEGEYNREIASTDYAGLMSASDKTKLDSIDVQLAVTYDSDYPNNEDYAVQVDDHIANVVGASNVTKAGYNSLYDAITTLENAISNKMNDSARGAANGVAPLNASSKIDSQYLPSFVDDVVEAYPRSGQAALSAGWLSATSGGAALTPETGKIYILMENSGDYTTNTQFRWGGSAYVKLNDGGVSALTTEEINAICV